MTQALMNNLNTLSEAFSAEENNKLADGDTTLDFSVILDSKIPSEAEENVDVQNSESKDIVKTALATGIEIFSEILSEAVSEAGAESAIDLDLAQELDTESTNQAEENFNENHTTKEENNTITEDNNTNENTDNTITNEDSTMRNTEQIYRLPLENPTNIVLIQPQIQQTKSTETTNSLEQENQTLKSYDSTKFNLKQDNSQTNKIIDISTKNIEPQTKSENNELKNIIDEEMVEELNIKSVSSSNAETQSDSGDLMQNQTPQEQAIKAVLHPETKYSDIKTTVMQQTVKTEEINHAKIIEQITKQMDGMKGNTSKLNIILNPESIGKISLQILNSKDGLMAQFTVYSQDAKNILMNGLDGLKDTLIARGVSLDNVSIKFEESQEKESQTDWSEQEGSRGGNKQQQNQRQKDDKKQFEQMMFEINNNGKL